VRTGKLMMASIALMATALLASPSFSTVASATTFPTRHVSANGGVVIWSVTVPGYGWCTWWSSPRVPKFNKTQRCEGETERSANLKPNIAATSKHYTFRLTFLGKETKTTDWMKLTEAGKTTTSPSGPSGSTYCVGETTKCAVAFPVVDDFGLELLLVGKVIENISCPDPGVCDQPAGDQLDAVLVGMGTGPSGMTQPGLEMTNFSLILAGGGQGRIDSITCDSSVEYALCALGAEGPSTTFAGVIIFDVPIGSTWQSVDFAYSSGSTSKVYVFTK